MYPVAQPAEGVPLQGRHEGYPAQPGVTTAVQQTIVNIPTEPSKDYVIWSIFNLVHCNPCCLGLAALIFSIKARDRRMVGDLNGTRNYASTARCLNIIATVLVFIVILSFIIVSIKTIVLLQSIFQSQNNYPYNKSAYNPNSHYRG